MADDVRETAVQKWFNWYVGGGRGGYPKDGLRDVFRSGYDAGYDAAQSALAAARIEGAKAGLEAAAKAASEFTQWANDAEGARFSGMTPAQRIRALDPAQVADAKGGER